MEHKKANKPSVPPKTRAELLARSRHIAGWTVAQLADLMQQPVPETLLHDKGWFGQLLENYLGATSGSLPQPDFPDLKVELKTIPVNTAGKPLESTYVCVVPLTRLGGAQWSESLVWRKLQCVLWFPIEGMRHRPIAERRLGSAFLWQPSVQQTEQLQQDWEEFAERIALGQVHTIDAKLGEVLQIRPKAANARARCQGLSEQGSSIETLPRGFYLRPQFTRTILDELCHAKTQ